MLKQLSIFAENKKGTMQQITQILFENDVNILGSVNNDSAEYGIVRMVVSDPDKAEQALQAAGYMTRQTDVLGVEVVDQPGTHFLSSLVYSSEPTFLPTVVSPITTTFIKGSNELITISEADALELLTNTYSVFRFRFFPFDPSKLLFVLNWTFLFFCLSLYCR